MAQPPLPFPQPGESVPRVPEPPRQSKPKPDPEERDDPKTLPDVTEGTIESGDTTPFEPTD